MTIFAQAKLAPRDPILGVTEAFLADTNSHKVNLGVGIYLNEAGQVPLLECVRSAAGQLAAAAKPYTYLPIDGLPAYNKAVKELVLGAESQLAERTVTVQGLGGTGALKIGAEFLKVVAPNAKVLISDPTWENHTALFRRAGFEVATYRYYAPESGGIDFPQLLADLKAAAAGTVVVLHACCHNPTGYDLDAAQWKQVADVIAERELLPFLDMAYQGFGSGIYQDGAAVREFTSRNMPVLVATSFSKSLGLYGERVGALSIVTGDADEAKRVLSQVKVCIRTLYSNPPTNGAQIATMVLTDPQLRAEWERELAQMRDRIIAIRAELVAQLQAISTADFSFIETQRGMFSYLGFSVEQMVALREKCAIYGTDAGRICVAAINTNNVATVARALASVV